MASTLPINEILQDLKDTLELSNYAVIQAPPGAGKTTRIPLSLMDEPWLSGKTIVMLEPRRIAAKSCAIHMASLLNEPVGKTVGYHIKQERKWSSDTRIEVVTEGILTRRLQSDPSLEGIGLVIFDEFHERHLNSDIGLALCLEVAEAIRNDLRLLVMSATLDTGRVAELMHGASVLRSEGRSWPVDVRYRMPLIAARHKLSVEQTCAETIRLALKETLGDILVFLPGVPEIKRLESLLNETLTAQDVSVFPLYGALRAKEQENAILPSPHGIRKIVLATSIAETSLTIEGVSVVIDSGLIRAPRFFPGTGMSRLETLQASLASTRQRKGRAGRTGPGICYRLWPEEYQVTRLEYTPPEILSADLSGLALELAAWGVTDPEELKWIDSPPEGTFSQAVQLLKIMGAVDEHGKVTSHGKQMVTLGVHPRLAHMMIRGNDIGGGMLACRIAALLEERDIFIGRKGHSDSDIRTRIEILESAASHKKNGLDSNRVNRSLLNLIRNNSRTLSNKLNLKHERLTVNDAGRILAFAYPERIALKRTGKTGEFKMRSGTGAWMYTDDALSSEQYIIVADTDGNRQNARIYRAAPYAEEWLYTDFRHAIHTEDTVHWNNKSRSVSSVSRVICGKLILSQSPLESTDPEAIINTLLKALQTEGMSLLPMNKRIRKWQARSVFLRGVDGYDELPDISDRNLTESAETWLIPFIGNQNSFSGLQSSDLEKAIKSLFSWNQLQQVEHDAPTHYTVPSGSRIPLDYGSVDTGIFESPVLSVRLQEMFGLLETPRIAKGKIPVTLHLLSPASKPMQVTQDLSSFWKTAYHDIKKDLKGRYPKHYWPDDPYSATATNKTKKRMAIK